MIIDLKNLKALIENGFSHNYDEINGLVHSIVKNYSEKSIFKSMIEECIILSKPPKRIVKKGTTKQSGTQFDAEIQCLCSEKVVQFTSFEVEPIFHFQNKEENLPKKLEHSHNNIWKVKNMKWKSSDPKRSSRSSADKCFVTFRIIAKANVGIYSIDIMKTLYSKSMIVVVHSNQEVDAMLSLFLDDYYGELLNSQFIEGNYGNLSQNISTYFKSETGRELTPSNISYLTCKMNEIFSGYPISMDDFSRKSMPSCKLSFGQWIMSIVRLLKIQTINSLWIEDYIEGFIEKRVDWNDSLDSLTSVLFECPGDFFLRFSESRVAVGVVLMPQNVNHPEAWKPFTDEECRQRSLSDRLCDFHVLKRIRKANGEFEDMIHLRRFCSVMEIDNGYTERGGRPFMSENDSISTILDNNDINMADDDIPSVDQLLSNDM